MAGVDVVVLEKGAFTTARDFTQDWGTMFGKIEGRRGLGTSRDNGVNLSFAETLGGTTVHYWANSFRTPTDRIERWNREFGLGFDPAQLAPLFQRLENNLSVHRTHDYLANATNRLMRLGTHAMRERSGDPRYRGVNARRRPRAASGAASGRSAAPTTTSRASSSPICRSPRARAPRSSPTATCAN